MLSHFNISSNIEGVAQVVPSAKKKDKLLHTLPLFHSFGYMTMWLGLNHGLPLVMHSNPLDAITVGQLVKEQKVTMLWTTPTFLQSYITHIPPDLFGSLRFVLTGAEKLATKCSDNFTERFGLRPVEGYGITECSPVIATSTLDIRLPGVFQVGSVPGSVGQPLPGVMVRIVDPDTFEELPHNTEGLLLVKGPNIMKGYHLRPDLTNAAMHDGWYITNDIALIDENEYIIITDRIARFSKIDGVIVPHTKIEEALHDAFETRERRFVVTTIPCKEKGEQIAIVHTAPQETIPQLVERLSAQGLPNPFIPRVEDFIPIDAIPLLATGKVNLRMVKHHAAEWIKGQ
jgi:acyl-[acyl-carrier-protein]-phospholipid O-acyltransferase/long-chain-fatty-acid--[acyl-carrier-protein] ligase